MPQTLLKLIVDAAIPYIAERIGLTPEMLRIFFNWLFNQPPEVQEAVANRIAGNMQAEGCDLPDCPDCDKDKVIDALAEYAKAA